MKRNWDIEELIENFTFLDNELSLLGNKTGATRLGFAVLFKFFQHEARFPNYKQEIPKDVIYYIAKQLHFEAGLFNDYNWKGRLINDLTRYEESDLDEYNNDKLSFSQLRADPERIGLESVLKEITKLKTIQKLNLPEKLFKGIPQKIIKKYKQRAVTEDIRELRRHPEPIRYTLLAAFFYLRSQEITDNLIELLIQIIHRIGVRAERKVDKQFINDFKKVNGKNGILFNIAKAVLNKPDGIVKDVLFPVVSEQIDGIVRPMMKETVIEKDDNEVEKINRINYEIVALQALRDKLRCKEIWVKGANRYRNPDERPSSGF